MNWALVKLQYELFGLSTEELASTHGVSLTAIEYAVKEGGWKKSKTFITDIEVPENTDLATFSDSILQSTKDKLALLNAYRQDIFAAQYLQLESVIVSKAIELAQELHLDSPTAIKDLKILSSTLESLLKHNNLLAPQAASEGAQGGGEKFVVQIVNNNGEVITPNTLQDSAIDVDTKQ